VSGQINVPAVLPTGVRPSVRIVVLDILVAKHDPVTMHHLIYSFREGRGKDLGI